MGYWNEIRELVGTRPLIMPGATLLVLNQEDQLLMLRRTDNQCWGVPGGTMELGETIEDTLKRETREEIGIDVNDFELFGVFSGKNLYYQYPSGDEVYNVSVVYIIRNIGEVIEVAPEEHSEYQYFDIHCIPSEVSPPIKPILQELVERHGKK